MFDQMWIRVTQQIDNINNKFNMKKQSFSCDRQSYVGNKSVEMRNKTRYLKPIYPEISKSILIQTPVEIYFNEKKKGEHIKNIIDSYFEITKNSNNEILRKFSRRSTILPSNQNKFKIKKRIEKKNNQSNSENLSYTYPKGFSNNNEPNQNNQNIYVNYSMQISKTFLSDHALPPIQQSADDPQIQRPFEFALSSLLLEDSRSEQKQGTVKSIENIKNSRKQKIIYQNELFVLYCFYQNKTAVSMLKQYRQQCKQIFIREQNIIKVLSNSNVETIWYPNAMLTCSSRYYPSLKNCMYQISRQSIKAEDIYQIMIKPYYNTLFMNQNQILLNIIKQICQVLVSIKDQVINNKISISNIFKFQDKFLIGQWAHSALKQTVTIGKQSITSITNPIIKGKNQWFATPEYLPPQLLEHIIGLRDFNLWENPSAIDMWSLGCMILQILTLVPLWMPVRCLLNHKKKVFRRGFFYSKNRDIEQIISKQNKFCSNFQNHFQKLQQISEHVNGKIIILLKKMLDLNYRTRLTPQQAISIIN